MYATIIKSAAVDVNNNVVGAPRVTIVIPSTPSGGGVQYWTRHGESRGIGWRRVDQAEVLQGEKVLGSPASVLMTVNDWSNIHQPTVLFQKLTREVENVSTPSSDAATSLQEIVGNATTSPTLLAKYFKANKYATQVMPQPIVVAPIPTVNILPPQAVAPVTPAPEVQVVVEEKKEEPMQSTITITDKYAALTVPEPEEYVKRVIFGELEDDIYNFARRTQQAVLISGDAGTGKTSSARNYAAENNLPFVTIECTQQIDQSITQGRFVPTGHGNEMAWKYSQLATAIQQPSVILINELSRMSPKAASLFLRLLMERELVIEPLNEVIKVHPDVLFIADQNVGSAYRGTQGQDSALIDRFNIKIEFKYDRDIEAKFIKSPTLLDFAVSIRQARELADEFQQTVTTRMLKNFQTQASGLSFEFAVNSFLNNWTDPAERDGAKMRFDAVLDSIASELGISTGNYNQ
jgi:MoxR-like ATPase